ncbi:MAG: hypothetical protein AB1512_02905 [Thermodesulfobacteriota bacterium]
MATFEIQIVGTSFKHRIVKSPKMKCKDVMALAGLNGYELFVEQDDFNVEPHESLDFVEDGQTLFAVRHAAIAESPAEGEGPEDASLTDI